MEIKGQHTFNEIMSQPSVWAEVIESFNTRKEQLVAAYKALVPSNALFIGCGSTHYLSQTAAALFQGLTDIPAKAAPSSELLLFPEQTIADTERTLLVAISRSGTTTETLQAVTRFRELGGPAVWVISCYPESELAQRGDLTLLASSAHEQSVAQTRSFTSMLILTQAMAATLAGIDATALESLPSKLGSMLQKTMNTIEELGSRIDLERLFFLGSGYQYGIANEAMLKMKEMSLTNSEAFHFMEYRHGPMSMATEKALIVGLVSDTARVHEERVLSEMEKLGSKTVGLNASSESKHDYNFVFEGQRIPAYFLPVLYLPPLQLMAYYRSINKGLDPDKPRNLEAVVSLDSTAFVSA